MQFIMGKGYVITWLFEDACFIPIISNTIHVQMLYHTDQTPYHTSTDLRQLANNKSTKSAQTPRRKRHPLTNPPPLQLPTILFCLPPPSIGLRNSSTPPSSDAATSHPRSQIHTPLTELQRRLPPPTRVRIAG